MRRRPVGKRCPFCSGSGKQGAMCSSDYCSCGGDGHAVTCAHCKGDGTKATSDATHAEWRRQWPEFYAKEHQT